jgi:hypothetical protein
LAVVTVTSTTAPSVPAGEVTVTEVAVLEETVAAVVPKSTAVGLERLVPSTVTCWPPLVGPELAMTEVTVGRLTAKAGSANNPVVSIAATTVTAKTFTGRAPIPRPHPVGPRTSGDARADLLRGSTRDSDSRGSRCCMLFPTLRIHRPPAPRPSTCGRG